MSTPQDNITKRQAITPLSALIGSLSHPFAWVGLGFYAVSLVFECWSFASFVSGMLIGAATYEAASNQGKQL